MRYFLLLIFSLSLSAENLRIEALGRDVNHHLYLSLSDRSLWRVNHLPPRHCPFQIKQVVDHKSEGKFLNLNRRFQFGAERVGGVEKSDLTSITGIPVNLHTTNGEEYRHFVLTTDGGVYCGKERRFDPWNGGERLQLIAGEEGGYALLNCDRREVFDVAMFCCCSKRTTTTTLCEIDDLHLTTEGGEVYRLLVAFLPALKGFKVGDVISLYKILDGGERVDVLKDNFDHFNSFLVVNQHKTSMLLVHAVK